MRVKGLILGMIVTVCLAPILALAADLPLLLTQESNRDAAVVNESGLLNYRRGNYSIAEEKFREADLIAPDNARIHFNLALTMYQLGNDIEGSEHLKKALELDPNDTAIKETDLFKAHSN